MHRGMESYFRSPLPYSICKVAKFGCRIYEVLIAYHGRTYAEGKKITWKDGIAGHSLRTPTGRASQICSLIAMICWTNTRQR